MKFLGALKSGRSDEHSAQQVKGIRKKSIGNTLHQLHAKYLLRDKGMKSLDGLRVHLRQGSVQEAVVSETRDLTSHGMTRSYYEPL